MSQSNVKAFAIRNGSSNEIDASDLSIKNQTIEVNLDIYCNRYGGEIDLHQDGMQAITQ